LISFTVAVLGSLSYGAATVIGLLALSPAIVSLLGSQLPDGADFVAGALVTLVSLLLHTRYYRRQLSKKNEQIQLAREEAIIGPTARQLAGGVNPPQQRS
jgi:hypothetical protein